MFPLGKRTKTITRRTLCALVLGQILPTLLLTPGQASAVLLHSHCDEPHHVHVLPGVELTNWTGAHAAEHHCATPESDTCCETSESPGGSDGVVLQRPPMLACRVRSVDSGATQPTFDTHLPPVTAADETARVEPPDTPRDVGPLQRCLDALLSSSHALLI